jgi:hypothetical protein
LTIVRIKFLATILNRFDVIDVGGGCGAFGIRADWKLPEEPFAKTSPTRRAIKIFIGPVIFGSITGAYFWNMFGTESHAIRWNQLRATQGSATL